MSVYRFTRRHALIGLTWCFSRGVAEAGAALSPEDEATVAKAVAYLEGLTSAKGRFEQVDGRGDITTGTFHLQRPGKARFDYDPPSGLAIASNGFKVTVVDRRLDTIQSYPLAATPLGLFLARHIRLDRGVAVTAVDRAPGTFTIVARDAHKRSQGAISMRFADAPLRLAGWTVTDSRGQSVQVRLAALSPSPPLGWQAFELSEPARAAGGTR